MGLKKKEQRSGGVLLYFSCAMQNDLPVPTFPVRFVPKEQIRQPPENIKLKHHEARKHQQQQQRRPIADSPRRLEFCLV
jgi:hypothetical protein